MATIPFVISHEDMARHDRASSHPAIVPNRLDIIADRAFRQRGVHFLASEEAALSTLCQVHSGRLVERVMDSQALEDGQYDIFAVDTIANRHTWRTMSLSVGGVMQAVNLIADKKTRGVFCIGYPGHHAGPNRAEGFCFLNPVAAGAHHARNMGFERVLVVDHDTHSGNGTIMSLWNTPEVRFMETNQPGYPGAFMRDNKPTHILRRKCTNVREFVYGWHRMFDELGDWKPDLVLVSAGFDGLRGDPLGRTNLSHDNLIWLMEKIVALRAPVIASLEGGYDVEETAEGVCHWLSALKTID